MMKDFKDNTGRQWRIELTIGAAKRIRSLAGVNLLELDQGEPPLLTRLGLDVMLLCDVVYAAVKPQADEAGVSDEQFGEALGGDAILAARKAFFEELADFFRSQGRADLARAIQAQERIVALAVEQVDRKIGEIDPEKAVTEAIEGPVTGGSSTSSPAASAATPAP
jgi:hypothetical protein